MKELPICGGPSMEEIHGAKAWLTAEFCNERPWTLHFRVDDPLEELEVSPTEIREEDGEVRITGQIFNGRELVDAEVAYNPAGPDGYLYIREESDDAASVPPIFRRVGANEVAVTEQFRHRGKLAASGRS